jgi:type IV pilus assembly protein PilN
MIRINLLPHRAEKRKAQQIQFIAFSVISVVLGAFIVGFVHVTIMAQIDYQERRNAYLNKEILVLDKQIDEIKKLREQTKSLLARKNVVENLQSTRADVVHLMDQVLRILPDGVYLKSLKQTGDQISVIGYAQSNARVSTFMRSIEDSPWLERPTLVEIHATTLSGARLSEFSLYFNLTKQLSSTPEAMPVIKPAAAKVGSADLTVVEFARIQLASVVRGVVL